MRWFEKLKVKQKIALSTSLVILFITGVSWLSIQWIVFPKLTGEIIGRGETISRSIARRGQQYLLANDHPKLVDLIFTEKWMEPNLLYIFVLDGSRQVAAHTFLEPFPQSLIDINLLSLDQDSKTKLVQTSLGPVYDTALALDEGIHRIGTVRVGLGKASIDRVMHPLMGSLLVILLLVISIAIFLTNWFSRQITGPILDVRELTRELVDCNFQACAHLGKRVECWRIKKCGQQDCPAYKRGRPPCWLLDDAPPHRAGGQPEPNKLQNCIRCEVYRTEVGDELQQLASAFCHMISKLDLYQAELKQANEDLKKLNRSYMEMLSFVSHELKSPIANSSMSAHALLQRIFGDLTPVQEKMVRLICRNLDHSVEMVKNYLNLSRIEKDELLFRPGKVRLGPEVVQPVLADLQPAIEARSMCVENSIGDTVILEADAELLQVVYRNLIGNACKYGMEGGRIRLVAVDTASSCRLQVWNEGPGVPKEKMNRLFRKFSRIEQPLAESTRGAGLGLFICRSVVEQHGGRIWADSREGEWTSFIIELPKTQEGRHGT
jgi:signal transduction histidine kinase